MYTFRYLPIWMLVTFLFISCRSSEPVSEVGGNFEREYTARDYKSIDRLSRAIQYRTVSYEDTTEIDYGQYEEFAMFLEKNFPNLYEKTELTKIGSYSLLYKWEGKNPSLNPVLLLGHYDVVPVSEGSKEFWDFPAFSGKVAEGFVWGRGALDDKSGIMSIVEAADQLMEEDFQPSRTIYIALHHDEEIGGERGARQVSEYLEGKDVELEYLV